MQPIPLLEEEQEGRSPGGVWYQTFGDCLSPGVEKRNKRLHQMTPGKTHLDEESMLWLARHQENARNKLELSLIHI